MSLTWRPSLYGSGSLTRGAFSLLPGTFPTIYRVTNLNDSGPGSLRAGMEAAGARLVIIEVSGTISLLSDILVFNSYLTVAGQTAPAPGILLKGDPSATVSAGGISFYGAHDCVLQHFEVRPGDGPPVLPETAAHDGILAYIDNDGNPSYNIVLDHMSTSWVGDKNYNLVSGPSLTSTVYRCISSEPLYRGANITPQGGSWNEPSGPPSSLGMLIGGTAGGGHVDVFESLFAQCADRNPEIHENTFVNFINNVIYNWGKDTNPYPWGTFFYGINPGAWFANIIGCKYIAGLPTTPFPPLYAIGTWAGAAGSQLYISDVALDTTRQAITQYFNNMGFDPRVGSPALSISGFSIAASSGIESTVLGAAGAHPAFRSAVDTRVINDVIARTGSVIASPSDVGGYPSLATNTRALSPPVSPFADSGDGYSNIEHWLFDYLDVVEAGSTPPTPPTPPIIIPSPSTGRLHAGIRPIGGKIQWPIFESTPDSDNPDVRVSQVVSELLDTSPFTDPEVHLSHIVGEILSEETSAADVRVSQVVAELLVRTNPLAEEPVFTDGTVSHPIGMQAFIDRNGDTHVHAEVQLNDEPDYEHGEKPPKILEFARIVRGLSDRMGQIEHLSFGVREDDKDYFWRGLLADTDLKYLTNRAVVQKIIDDEDRRLEKPWRVVANGFVSNYGLLSDLEFRLECTDWLKRKYTRSRNAQNAWQPRLTLTDFASCPPDNLNKGVPIIYGPYADDLSTGAGGGPGSGPVIAALNGAFGVYPYGVGLNGPEMGGTGTTDSSPLIDTDHRSYGVLAGTVPTSPTIAPQSGGNLPGTRNDSWTVMVTAVHSGVESDPSPMVQCNLDWAGGQRSVQIDWTAASGGATSYRVYLTNNPFGTITKMSTAFPPFQIASDYCWMFEVSGATFTLTVTDPGTNYPVENIFLYTIAAIKDDIESPTSGIIVGMSHPYARPIHLRWLPYTGFGGSPDNYVIRRASYTGVGNTPNFDTTWTVPNDGVTGAQTIDGVTQYEFFDDFTASPSGVVTTTTGTGLPPPAGVHKPLYAGKVTIGSVTGDAFIVGAHACKLIRSIYSGGVLVDPAQFGSTIWAPGFPGWASVSSNVFIDRTVGRYTLIILTGALAQGAIDGTLPLTVNVEGIETAGDGSGDVIVRGAQQAKHFCSNWLAPDSPTYGIGGWEPSTAFIALPGIPLVNEDSFDAADTATEDRIPTDGYQGAGVIGKDGEIVSAEEAIARFARSYDLEFFFERTGALAGTIEPVSAPSDPEAIDDIINIVEGSFQLDDLVTSEFFNVIPYVHTEDGSGRTSGGWLSALLGEIEARDSTSIANYEQEIASQTFEMHFGWALFPEGAATIADVLQRKLARYTNPRRKVTGTLPFQGTSIEVGDIFSTTAIDGTGATGWHNVLVRATHHELDIDRGQVRIDGYDMTPIL